METWANVPVIIAKGADWYSAIGTEGSKGTKIFSLVGQVKNVGLVEVPMGVTIKELVMHVGGGVPDGKEFKAIQIGGPSGRLHPPRALGPPHRLRLPLGGGRHYGFRGHDRHGQLHLHGGCGQVFPGLSH